MKAMFFPLQAKDECNCTLGKTFSMEKLFPNLSTTYKKNLQRVAPHPLKPVCRLHQSKEVCATETIHSNTLSKHTRAS